MDASGAGGEDGQKPSPGLLDLLAMGLSSALFIAAGVVSGVLLDDWVHTSPVFSFLGLALGVVAAIASTVRQVRKYL
jgi:F0F1-type ATP synthase assembly protein I